MNEIHRVPSFKRIRNYKTENGFLSDIFDSVVDDSVIKKVYMTSLDSNSTKGVILHKSRTTYVACIKGSVLVIWNASSYKGSVVLRQADEMINDCLIVPPGTAVEYRNETENLSFMLCMADEPYDTNEFERFDSWDDYKNAQSIEA